MQEILQGVNINQNADNKKTLQNVQIHIGDDPVYQNNPMCPGGPFLNDDPSNQTTFTVPAIDDGFGGFLYYKDENDLNWSVTNETW